MAIKTNNSIVIDNNKNFLNINSISYIDSSVQTTVISNDKKISYGLNLKNIILNPNVYGNTTDDEFGSSVAISDKYIAISAEYEEESGGANSGKVYVYDVNTCALIHTINNPSFYSTPFYDRFGITLKISNNYLIVSSIFEDFNSGKVYIFNISTGELIHTLNNPNAYSTSTNDYFGIEISAYGNYLAVGAEEDDANGLTSGKVYIFNVTTGELVQTLNNPNAYSTSTNDYFGGYSYRKVGLEISEKYCVVGAPGEDDATANDQGKAYVFDLFSGNLIRTFNNPNFFSNPTYDGYDLFGSSIAISGNYVLIAALAEGSGLNPSRYPGVVYVFNILTGSLINTLFNPNFYNGSPSAGENFGYSMKAFENYCLISAPFEAGENGIFSDYTGIAYIFNFITGQLIHTFHDPNSYRDRYADYFGYSLDIFGNNIVISARREDYGNLGVEGLDSGVVYTYTFEDAYDLYGIKKITFSNGFELSDDHPLLESTLIHGNNFEYASLVKILNNPNSFSTSEYDNFGNSVAISGNYAIVSAIGEDDSGGASSGKVYVFDIKTGVLLYTINNPNVYSTSTNDRFGNLTIKVSNKYFAVGTYEEDDINGTGSGVVYIFDIKTGSLLITLKNPNVYGTSTNDFFGYSFALSDNYCVVGAYNESDPIIGPAAGKTYVFDIKNGKNTLLYYINDPDSYAYGDYFDTFGYSVAISGNLCAIGAPREEIYDFDDEGVVYIFNLSTGTLISTIKNPDSYYETSYLQDYFGYTLDMTSDYLVISAPREITGPNESDDVKSGVIYVYSLAAGGTYPKLLHTIKNPNAYGTAFEDFFANNGLMISEKYCIASTVYEDSVDGIFTGIAYIFDLTTGALVNTLKNPSAYSTSTNDSFGNSVAISGNYAIVGASAEDDAGGYNSGKAYIFSGIKQSTLLDRVLDFLDKY